MAKLSQALQCDAEICTHMTSWRTGGRLHQHVHALAQRLYSSSRGAAQAECCCILCVALRHHHLAEQQSDFCLLQN